MRSIVLSLVAAASLIAAPDIAPAREWVERVGHDAVHRALAAATWSLVPAPWGQSSTSDAGAPEVAADYDAPPPPPSWAPEDPADSLYRVGRAALNDGDCTTLNPP